jgi:hypothetical protein
MNYKGTALPVTSKKVFSTAGEGKFYQTFLPKHKTIKQPFIYFWLMSHSSTPNTTWHLLKQIGTHIKLVNVKW